VARRPIRGVPSEVVPNVEDGMKSPSAVNLHNAVTVSQQRLGKVVAQLSSARMSEVCAALRFSLGCYANWLVGTFRRLASVSLWTAPLKPKSGLSGPPPQFIILMRNVLRSSFLGGRVHQTEERFFGSKTIEILIQSSAVERARESGLGASCLVYSLL
jgi:hypothetical protein